MRIMMKLLRTNRDLRWLFIAQAVGVRWTITAFASAAGLAGFAYIALTRPVMLRLRAEEAAAAETVKVQANDTDAVLACTASAACLA